MFNLFSVRPKPEGCRLTRVRQVKGVRGRWSLIGTSKRAQHFGNWWGDNHESWPPPKVYNSPPSGLIPRPSIKFERIRTGPGLRPIYIIRLTGTRKCSLNFLLRKKANTFSWRGSWLGLVWIREAREWAGRPSRF